MSALRIEVRAVRTIWYWPLYSLIWAMALLQCLGGRDPSIPNWMFNHMVRIRFGRPKREGQISRWLSRRALRSQVRALMRLTWKYGLQHPTGIYAMREWTAAVQVIRALK